MLAILIIAAFLVIYELIVSRSGLRAAGPTRTAEAFVGDANLSGTNAPTRHSADEGRFAAAARSAEAPEGHPYPSRGPVDSRPTPHYMRDRGWEAAHISGALTVLDPARTAGEIELAA